MYHSSASLCQAKMSRYAQGRSASLQPSSKRTVFDTSLYSTPTRRQDFPPYIAFQELALFLRSPHDESPSPSPIGGTAKGKRKAESNNVFLLSSSCLMRCIQQPSNIRLLVTNGLCSVNFATYSGGYISSLCSHSSCQQLEKFLSSRPPSSKTFRRRWSRAHWSLHRSWL